MQYERNYLMRNYFGGQKNVKSAVFYTDIYQEILLKKKSGEAFSLIAVVLVVTSL